MLAELNKMPDLPVSDTKVLVTVFSPELKASAIKTAADLREENIPTEIFPDQNKKLDKQLKYADRKKIPYAVIVGPDEAERKTYLLKDLNNREQRELELRGLIAWLKRQISAK